MNDLKDANRQKALALAAMAKGVAIYAHDDNGLLTGLWMVDLYTFHFVCEGEGLPKQSRRAVAGKVFATPLQAYVAAAEALGLEPDPAVQQQPLALHPAQYAHLERAVTTALAELDKHGQPHAVGCDLAGAWGMLKGILQQQEQTRPALTEAQKESLLIVAEVASDLAFHADALTVGANSGPNARQLRSWCDELDQPASLLATLFDLAPKESTPDPQEGGPADA